MFIKMVVHFFRTLCCVLDTYIQKNKKAYIDSRARRNLGSINTELQDVQRIMVANIEEVLQRGEALSSKYKGSSVFAPSFFSKIQICSINSDLSFFSSRHKSQQSVHAVEEVPQRR